MSSVFTIEYDNFTYRLFSFFSLTEFIFKDMSWDGSKKRGEKEEDKGEKRLKREKEKDHMTSQY